MASWTCSSGGGWSRASIPCRRAATCSTPTERASRSERAPVRVYAADFDQNGTVDPVLSCYLQGEEYPVASRDLMVDQLPAMAKRFPHYGDYAQATLERTLSRAERKQAYVARAVTFASSYV